MFLVLVAVMVALFAMGRPTQTLIGAGVIALGIPVSRVVVRKPQAMARSKSIVDSA